MPEFYTVSFRFIQLIQQEKEISALNISDSPKIKVRILNHWDNLDRTVERGYAGFSLWDWFDCPMWLTRATQIMHVPMLPSELTEL
jgi:alpha-glucuronidase